MRGVILNYFPEVITFPSCRGHQLSPEALKSRVNESVAVINLVRTRTFKLVSPEKHPSQFSTLRNVLRKHAKPIVVGVQNSKLT
eukprot:m.166574 g.166574  ORF g.166574 m.166574 type:complete len:84 (+) comp14706_c0_seq15:181-432(+)